MKTSVRRRVAYIAGSLISPNQSSGVYDYQEGKYFPISGQLQNDHISIYDHSTSSSVSGTGSNGRYSLYDHEESGSITLEINNGSINGYDYISSCSFNGQVSVTGEVSLYDYGISEYFSYRI